MLGELLLFLVVRTIVRVFLLSSMYMDCLEKRCVLMIGVFLFDFLLVLLEFLRLL